MKLLLLLIFSGFLSVTSMDAADVYGSAATAQSTALGGIYLNSIGPTDALASNPAMLASIGRANLELTGMGVLAGGSFRNSTPITGRLESNAGIVGSASFGMTVPHTRLSLGVGVFPVSLLSDKWFYQDPAGIAGATYGLRTNKSAFLAIQSSTGFGVQISRKVAVGASLGIADNLNTLEMPYIFQANPKLAGLKTLLRLHTSGLGYNGTFGILSRPTKRLELGAAYKTETTVHSIGSANGDAYAQFRALGLPYSSSFHYRAEVGNVFPQSASLSLAYQMRPRVKAFLQGDWLDWHDAFNQLQVRLTKGDNILINTLVKSTSLDDCVPLHWKNQTVVRTGMLIPLSEHTSLQAAYSHASIPVPASTLTPLTAAIMTDALSAGLAFARNRYHMQFAYQVNLPQTARVGTSGLLAGEYSNTQTSLWLQTLALTTDVRF